MSFFELGGEEVPMDSALDLSQEIDWETPRTDHRMHGGALKRQSGGWKKIITTISGGGWFPPALEGLDYESSMTLKCAVTLAVKSVSNVVAVPANRRSDMGYEPQAFAITGNDRTPTGFDLIVGDTYTATPIPGADYYVVDYFPEIEGFADEPKHNIDRNNVRYSWTLTFKEK